MNGDDDDEEEEDEFLDVASDDGKKDKEEEEQDESSSGFVQGPPHESLIQRKPATYTKHIYWFELWINVELTVGRMYKWKTRL
jgi:hypothetical protein